MSSIERITYRGVLHPNSNDATPLDDDTIVQFTLPHGVIEIRHRGTYLEVNKIGLSATRLLMEPLASNLLTLTVEP
jgi:hypothetical protein